MADRSLVGEDQKGRKILIVEDERDLALTCARLLQRMGHVPLIALDGREALERIEAEAPDLILTDLRLPEGDGLTVLRHARSGARKIPVILFTAYSSEPSRREALEEGAVAYLCKPFSAAVLRAVIERALTAV